jgi:UDP-2,3-diacylglucosamine hydrolase
VSGTATLFISDLHLDASRPACTELFCEFLAGPARSAQALYILGDLFEVWIGDDAANDHDMRVMDAMAAYAASGIPCSFMRGNRDFLIGPAFAEHTGFRLLEDPCVIELNGTPTLLSHGDTLCTDDIDYQRFRRKVRDPAWQARFLSRPLGIRRLLARLARLYSRMRTRTKSDEIVDVTQKAVDSLMQTYGIDTLIHGHTHRPAIHKWSAADGTQRTRAVLGDWYDQGSVLVADSEGLRLEGLGNTHS